MRKIISLNKDKEANEGITLIALVITIIVLLILAAISIATLTGENGILTKATEAKDLSKTAEEKEQIGLAYNAVLAEKMKKGDKTAVTAEELEVELKKLNPEVTVKENSQPIEVTFSQTGNKYKVDGSNGNIEGDENTGGSVPELSLQPTEETKPYLPDDKSKVLSNDINEGIVVKDSKQNEWVWIEVPRTTAVYKTAGLEITNFTEEEYTKIENDLKTYTNDYRNGTSYKDEWNSEAQHGFADADAYNNHKKSMLKSVYQNGGFYIGRYEAGATTYVQGNDNGAREAIVKQDAYPYNYVTCKKAQELSEGLTTEGKTSSLMFGVQWDLVLKYIEERGTKLGTTKEERKSKIIKTTYDLVSSDWGNYYNTDFTIERGEYSTNNGATYAKVNQEEGYPKPSNTSVLLTTGATNRNSVLNIYDLAGNDWEWTLEYTASTYYPCAYCGGYYNNNGSNTPASGRYNTSTSGSNHLVGFRPALW